MKVSVVVPVWNAEAYLARCVDSILGQTLTDIEVVLVDDGSTDASGAMIDDYAARDRRVVAIHTENRGPGMAILTGARAARGNYLAIYDNDDYAPLDALERLYEKAGERAADLVVGDYWESPCYDSPDFVRIHQPAFDEETDPARAIGRWLNREHKGALWAMLIRRELYLEHVFEFPLKRHSEDVVVMLLLLRHARKIVRLDRPVYYYVVRRESWSHYGLEDWDEAEKERDVAMLRWVLDSVERMPERAALRDPLAYYALLRLSWMQVRRGKARQAVDLSEIERRIYRDHFGNRPARRRLRQTWPKPYIYLMAERHAGWRIVKRIVWGTPLARKTVRALRKIVRK